MLSEDLYNYARKRVAKRRKFYSHLVTWLVMSVFFILINLATTNYFWAIFPILFWGIGVALDGIRVFSSEWEDNEVDREYERLRKRRGLHSSDDSEDHNMPLGKKKMRQFRDNDFV